MSQILNWYTMNSTSSLIGKVKDYSTINHLASIFGQEKYSFCGFTGWKKGFKEKITGFAAQAFW